jgi:hypothetical protein
VSQGKTETPVANVTPRWNTLQCANVLSLVYCTTLRLQSHTVMGACLLFGRTYEQGFTLQLSFPSAATAAAGDGNIVSNSNGTTTWLLQAGTQGTAPHLKCVKNRCAVKINACPVSHRFRCGVCQDKLKMSTVEDFIDCCDAGSCPTVTVGNGTLPSLRAGEWATVRLLAQRSGSSLASDVGGEGGGKTLLQLWVNGVSLLNASVDTSVEARGAGT